MIEHREIAGVKFYKDINRMVRMGWDGGSYVFDKAALLEMLDFWSECFDKKESDAAKAEDARILEQFKRDIGANDGDQRRKKKPRAVRGRGRKQDRRGGK